MTYKKNSCTFLKRLMTIPYNSKQATGSHEKAWTKLHPKQQHIQNLHKIILT